MVWFNGEILSRFFYIKNIGFREMAIISKRGVCNITKGLAARLFMAALLIILWSCGDDNSSEPVLAGYSRGGHYALVVYSSAGIGDGGFEDNIYTGFVASADSLGYVLENLNPLDLNSAEESISRFFSETKDSPYEKRLLVLAASEYLELLKKHSEWKQNKKNEILLLDSAPDSLDIYTRDISLYGASYMAGAAVAKKGLKNVELAGANSKSNAVNMAISGFRDGYKSSGGSNADSLHALYLGDEENEGFDIDATYYLSHSYAQANVDFVFPVIGGSNGGLFRYLRENPNEDLFLTCGMDTDQQHLSGKIAFSIVKRMDILVKDFMRDWAEDEDLPRKFLGTLETGLVDIVVAKNYSSWSDEFEKVRSSAVKAEKKFLERK